MICSVHTLLYYSYRYTNAIYNFELAELDMHQFRLSGQELCTLNRQDFQKRTSDFVAGIMYAYLGCLKEGEPQVVVWGGGGGGGRGEGRVQS